MNLNNYEKISLKGFMGLYARGSVDNVPIDHLSTCQNLDFNKKGEINARNGVVNSITGLGFTPVRFFEVTFSNSTIVPLAADGAGNIYRLDTKTVLLFVTNMVDFVALNMFNKCFILPILSSFSANNPIYVWDGTHAPRVMAGAAPTLSFSAADSGVGNVPIGVHQFAVSYITNTGYTTPPGPVIAGVFAPVSLNAAGGKQVQFTGLPLGPSQVVGRQLFATKSGLSTFYYFHTINDNVTTSITLDFFDTDLAVSADSLFDLIPSPQGGVGFGGCGLAKYHGRMLIITGDTVLVSNAGDAESIDSVTGQIIVPAEFDGNQCRAASELFGVLYFFKAVGIYSTQDNGGDPNTWEVSQIDGEVGAYQGAIASIIGSQSSLSSDSILLMANRQGLFGFNGNVQRPYLSWKIDDVWSTITHGTENRITVVSDAYNDRIYVLMCCNGASTPNTLLVADHSLGISSDNLRWSTYSFQGITPKCMSMMNYNDISDFDYWLRLGISGAVAKIRINKGDNTDLGSGILPLYGSPMVTFDEGSVNIFTFLRFHGFFNIASPLTIFFFDEGGTLIYTTTTSVPATRKDIGIPINLLNEKVYFQLSGTDNTLRVNRLDIFGKKWWGARTTV